ncbi:MAG: molybdenum cofactor guanylyltransferase, partial [Ilumatobacteraceae bacterium]
MGASKAALEWHGSTLLYRTAALLSRTVVGPVVVVAAPDQQLPALPIGVQVVDDPVEGLGPMLGIASGLAAVADRATAAFVCSTDMPFLHPAFINRVLHEFAMTDTDVVLPMARGFRQPLAAVYRTELAGLTASLALAGELRLPTLFEHCRLRRIDDQELLADDAVARFDGDLESVMNLNTPDEYEEARRRPPAEVTVECFGTL